jgi:hypothetical protein
MARVTRAKLLRPFFVAAVEAETAQREWNVSANLVSLAVEKVATTGRNLPGNFAATLAKIANDFALDRSTQSFRGDPGSQKQMLKVLRDGGDVGCVLNALAPEFTIELSKYLHPHRRTAYLKRAGH